MKVINAELLAQNLPGLKFILNESGVLFFPAAQQHRDVKAHALTYEDDYHGNAVAGIVASGRVDIRFHQAFSIERIRAVWSRLKASPEFAGRELGKLYYQGREIM